MLLAEKVLAKTATEIKTLQVEEDYLRHTVAELLDLDVSKGDEIIFSSVEFKIKSIVITFFIFKKAD